MPLKPAFSVLSVGTGHDLLMMLLNRRVGFLFPVALTVAVALGSTQGAAASPDTEVDGGQQPPEIAGTGGDRDNDQDDVWHAEQSGDLIPFSVLLDLAKAKIDGEIITIQFKRVGDKIFYVFKFIDKRGHVGELAVDAHTGAPFAITDD